MIQKRDWRRDAQLPNRYSWLASGPDGMKIWAAMTDNGWRCQFAHGQWSISATGTSRDRAAHELITAYLEMRDLG